MSPASGSRAPRWLRLAPLAALGALLAGLAGSGVLGRVSLTTLEADHAALAASAARHPVQTAAAFLGLYCLMAAACAPGLFVMTLAAGFLFGPLVGGVITVAALVSGGLVTFLACRSAFGDWLARRAGGTLARIEAGFSRDAFAYLLALRLMPVAPFFMVTLAAGLARTRPSSFVLATAIGSAPSSFVIAALGAGLGGLFARRAPIDARVLLRPEIAVPLAALAVLALAGPAIRVWRSRGA